MPKIQFIPLNLELMPSYPVITHLRYSIATQRWSPWGWAVWGAQPWTRCSDISQQVQFCHQTPPSHSNRFFRSALVFPQYLIGSKPHVLERSLLYCMYALRIWSKLWTPFFPPKCKCCPQNRCSSFYFPYSPVAQWPIAGRVQENRDMGIMIQMLKTFSVP